tara:strand:- start:561 stop:1607 length:1047 start_codon:yes stop_codon:yes gene_type:complete
MIFTSGLLLHAITSPFLGKYLDRDKTHILMPLSGFVLLVGFFLQITFDGFYIFVLSWLLIGWSSAGLGYDICFSFLTIRIQNNPRKYITIVTLIAGFASTITFPLSNYLLTMGDWKFVIEIFLFIALLIGIPCNLLGLYLIRQQKIPAVSRVEDVNYEKIYLDYRFYLILIPITLVSFNHSALITHTIPILIEKNYSNSFGVFIISLLGPSQVAGRILINIIPKHIKNLHIRFFGEFVLVACLIMLLFSEFSILLPILYICFQGAVLGIDSIISPLIQKEVFGTTNFGKTALYMSSLRIGIYAMGPFIASVLWGFFGYNITILLMVCLTVIASLGSYKLINVVFAKKE